MVSVVLTRTDMVSVCLCGQSTLCSKSGTTSGSCPRSKLARRRLDRRRARAAQLAHVRPDDTVERDRPDPQVRAVARDAWHHGDRHRTGGAQGAAVLLGARALVRDAQDGQQVPGLEPGAEPRVHEGPAVALQRLPLHEHDLDLLLLPLVHRLPGRLRRALRQVRGQRHAGPAIPAEPPGRRVLERRPQAVRATRALGDHVLPAHRAALARYEPSAVPAGKA
ncbi:hypothetical protein PybrP1_003244 [[Pythium] brassicae (nom. inval.)]|nr:hypothetical protein PybrP1_003244 [[Pythium] brassicae (nom. inval.)]